jgi:hypothetical protein
MCQVHQSSMGEAAALPRRRRGLGWWGAPFASVLAEPLVVRACAGVAAAQIALSAAKLPAWPCVFYHVTGLPCPGCGLTRSCIALLHGDAVQSLRYHPFGPFLLAGILLLAVGALMPRRMLAAMAARVAALERVTALPTVLTILFMCFWPLRLAGIFPLPH